MPKAYWIGHVSVGDPDIYEGYRRANAEAFAKYNARFLVRGGPQSLLEGEMRNRSVVIEFADLATAQACYDSPEYAAARSIRESCSLTDLVIVEGWADCPAE
ncbi:DUF1330 domain-containing protein [Paracoccus cavernae]|uniref:DUF1330 domain-containing protein n=1 Tax=Paracoccus cavernae TaxID=1571207 RepID=A0ABT8D4V5_9RHOB|nr:DUF1330 domain-containing protein [Paracoccus cavernae]